MFAYGLSGDQPLIGDWNNDGIDTVGVYRNNTFYLRNTNTAGIADLAFGLGNPGDLPVAGDWDGLPSSIPPTSTPAPPHPPLPQREPRRQDRPQPTHRLPRRHRLVSFRVRPSPMMAMGNGSNRL